MNKFKPICVDLDGTLIKNDVTIEAIKQFIAEKFWNIFKIIFWLFFGRAYLKRKLSDNIDIDVSNLEYNKQLLDFIIVKKNEGHQIFLATACDRVYADKIADSLKIFDGVFASDGVNNLRSKSKAQALVIVFGERGFIYAGNSKDDVEVWNKSAESILVHPSRAALNKMKGKKYILFN